MRVYGKQRVHARQNLVLDVLQECVRCLAWGGCLRLSWWRWGRCSERGEIGCGGAGEEECARPSIYEYVDKHGSGS